MEIKIKDRYKTKNQLISEIEDLRRTIFKLEKVKSELRNTEANLRKKETILNTSQSLTKAGGWEYDIEKQTMFWTDETYIIHGFKSKEDRPDQSKLIESSAACYYKKDRAVILEAFQKCVSEGKPYDYEFPFKTVNGDHIWIRTTAEAKKVNGEVVKVAGNIIDITEYKRSAEKLQESENKYRELFEKSKDAVLIIENGTFIDCNQATVDMLGYKNKVELLQTHPSELSPEKQPDGRASAEKADEMMRTAIEKGGHRFEWDHVRANGDVFPVEVLLTPITIETGRQILHTVWRDITERKQAEKEIRESQELSARLISALPDMIVRLDMSGRIIYISDSGLKMSGYKLNDVLNKSFMSFIAPEDRERAKRNAVLMVKKKIGPQEYFLIRKDGQRLLLEVNGDVLRDEDGVPQSIVQVCRDITERKQAEEALKQSEEKYSTIMHESPLGIFYYNSNGVITDCNKSFIEIVGSSRQALIGFNLYERLEDEKLKAAVFESLTDGSSYYEDLYSSVTSNKQTYVRMLLKGFLNSGGKYTAAIGLVEDITIRKQAEESLRKEKLLSEQYMNSLPGLFYVFDEEKFVRWNDQWYAITGYTSEELAGMYGTDFFEGAGQKLIAERMQEVFEKGKSEAEAELITKDGRRIPCFFSGIRKEIDGKPHLVGLGIDITKRKEAEKAISESEERYRKLFNSSKDAIMTLAPPSWKFTSGNPSILKMFNVKDFDEFTSIGPWDVSPEKQPDGQLSALKAQKMIKKAMEQGSNYFEWTHKRLRGREFAATVLLTRVDLPDSVFLQATVRDITKERKNLDALRESEDRFRRLFAGLGDAVFVTKAGGRNDGKILEVNPAAELQTGYTKSELLQMNILKDLSIENSAEMNTKEWDKKLANGEVVSAIEKKRKKDGTEYWTEVIITPIEYKGIKAALSINHDIDERKKAEEALYESEQKMRILVEGTPNFFFYTQDTNADVTYISPSIEKITGHKAAEWVGQKHWFVTENEINKLAVQRTHANLHGEFSDEEIIVEVYHADGNKILLQVYEHPILKDGKVVGLQGIAHDITQRSQAEKALKESEEKFREMAELLPEIIYETDINANLTFVNKRAFEKFGYSQNDFDKGINALQMLIPEDAERGRENMKSILEGKSIGSPEYTARKKDGTSFPVLIYSSPVFKDNKPAGLRGLIVDITDRRRLEEQLQQSQKMEAVGQLAGGVAHDFNNLLTIINGYCDLLEMSKLPDSILDPVKQIHNAGNRAAQLTNQLLAFSRRQIIQPVVLNLNSVISDYMKMLSRLLGEDIKIITLLNPRIYDIEADPGQIEQIIMNIAINARDAMPFGGKLTIETDNILFDDEFIRNNPEAEPGKHAMLAVSDNGAGMDELTLTRIFEPFFTTKGRDKGTGLGLATVYGIVKQNNGYIQVSSEPHKGTTFKMYLPQVLKEDEKDQDTAKLKIELSGSETILLVEDNENVREVTSASLQQFGYTVLGAASGDEAVKLYHENRDSISLVLTDVIMPEMSGRELAEKIISEDPDMKILYFSGYTDDSIVHHGVLDEGTEFIQKPFSHKDLALKIKSMLRND